MGTIVAVSVARFLCPDSRAATTASHLPDNTNKNVGSIMASHGPGLLAHDQTPELKQGLSREYFGPPMRTLCEVFICSAFKVQRFFTALSGLHGTL